MNREEFKCRSDDLFEFAERILRFPVVEYLAELRQREAQLKFKGSDAAEDLKVVQALRSLVEIVDKTKPKLMRPAGICRAARDKLGQQPPQPNHDRQPGQELIHADSK